MCALRIRRMICLLHAHCTQTTFDFLPNLQLIVCPYKSTFCVEAVAVNQYFLFLFITQLVEVDWHWWSLVCIFFSSEIAIYVCIYRRKITVLSKKTTSIRDQSGKTRRESSPVYMSDRKLNAIIVDTINQLNHLMFSKHLHFYLHFLYVYFCVCVNNLRD